MPSSVSGPCQQRLFGGGSTAALLQGEETGFDVDSLVGAVDCSSW